MLNRASTALVAALAIMSAAPAIADDGQIVITQAKANAGNVTPGDAAGFPVKLSQPGSYILASNLNPPAGKGGINIASNDVTIDMNGFRLDGVSGTTTGINGGAFDSATIRNGTVGGFDGNGIHGTGAYWVIEDMRVLDNDGDYGIHLPGSYASVRGSTVARNQGTGIRCSARCLVEDSTSSENGGIGIWISSGTILGNVITGNSGLGIQGGLLTGYGNNTLAANNGGGANAQVTGVTALHPNACSPACP